MYTDSIIGYYLNVYIFLIGVVMVLAGSFEFDKFHNQEITERPSDNEEVPQVRQKHYYYLFICHKL